MRNLLLLLFAAVDLAASVPYILDTYQRKTRPNLASWSTWVLVNGIAAASAFAAGGALNSVVLSTGFFIGSAIILGLAVTRGTRRYTLFDGVCQGLALVGVVLWLLADNPNVALLFAVTVDVLAALPSFRHAYHYPHEETWTTFLVAGLVAVGTLCLATSFRFAALAYPLDNTLINLGLAAVILYGRARRHRPIAAPDPAKS